MEQECIKTNISVYNNLAVCILANARENSVSNADQEYEKVVKYTGVVYKKSYTFRLQIDYYPRNYYDAGIQNFHKFGKSTSPILWTIFLKVFNHF